MFNVACRNADFECLVIKLPGKYVGNRPIKLRKSNWKERTDYEALGRQKVKRIVIMYRVSIVTTDSDISQLRVIACFDVWQNFSQKRPKLSKKSVLHK